MTDDTIKVSDDTKEELDEIKENYYEYTTLSYSEAVDVLIAEYHKETTRASGEDDTGSDVTRTMSGGENSAEVDENQGMTAAEKADKFRQ